MLDWRLMQKQAGVAKVGREQLLNYLAENGVRVSETEDANGTDLARTSAVGGGRAAWIA